MFFGEDNTPYCTSEIMKKVLCLSYIIIYVIGLIPPFKQFKSKRFTKA